MSTSNMDTTTLLTTVDQIAREDPDRIYCIQPISSDIADGWKRITFRDVHNASNRMARWIQQNVASTEQSEVFAYSAANDIRYVAIVLACMRLRHTPLLLSSRNPPQASQHLMSATHCSKLLYSSEREKQISAIVDYGGGAAIETFEIPPLWEIYNSDVTSTLIEEPPSDADDRVAIYIHTSGTTGMPKVVPLKNSYFNTLENICKAPVPEGRTTSMFAVALPGVLAFSPNPFFHIMGIFYIAAPMLFGTSYVVSPERPLSAELLARILEETKPRVTAIAPSILEDLSSSELGIKCIESFDWITYGGAPMDPAIGDRISKIVHLQAVMGASECSFIASLKHQNTEDWQCHEWNPNIGYEMREVADGLYELVIRGGEHRMNQAIFRIFPDAEEYCTGDLFSPHFEKPGLWYFSCRKDDIIVLSNGEKFNPSDMEATICSHPKVSRAIVLGQGRFQSAAIIEPQNGFNNNDTEAFIDNIWSAIKSANDIAPAYARLARNRLILSISSKPFQLTPKGSVRKKVTLLDYKDIIDALYENKSVSTTTQLLSKESSRAEISGFLTTVLASLLDIPKVAEDADIFALGLDSLQTLRLSQQILGSLDSTRPGLDKLLQVSELYSLPSISRIADRVFAALHDNEDKHPISNIESDDERMSRINGMVAKYTSIKQQGHVIILTGSTGSLGTYILSELLRDSSVTRIYCLNRSADAASRQLESLKQKGLQIDLPEARVEFLEAEFGSERLGLDASKYNEMAQAVDTIIHNAWKVNFNHKLEAFEDPHIKGVQHFVDFAASSVRRAHIHLISSISTIEGSHHHYQSIPEAIFEDGSLVLRQGYAESKHVAERMCAAASNGLNIPTTIHRVGQISGPTTEKGLWNKQEWLPSIIATSKAMNKVPSSLAALPIQWVPVDSTAQVIMELVQSRRMSQNDELCAAFHIINPKTTDWESLLPTVVQHFGADTVSLSEWIDELRKIEKPTVEEFQNRPALKILDALQGLASLENPRATIETSKTEATSETLRGMKAIDAGQMQNWLRQWDF